MLSYGLQRYAGQGKLGGTIAAVMKEVASNAERFVRRYGESWESWDIDGFLALFGKSVTYVAHPDEIVEGLPSLRRYLEKEKRAQGSVEVHMGTALFDGERVMAEFWVVAADDASIAGCLIAHLDEEGLCNRFREYWFDLAGSRAPFDGWGS